MIRLPKEKGPLLDCRGRGNRRLVQFVLRQLHGVNFDRSGELLTVLGLDQPNSVVRYERFREAGLD